MKLEKAVQLFLLQYPNKATHRAYRCVLQQLVEVLDGQTSVKSLTPADLLAFSVELNKRSYADATKMKYIKAIKTFFKWLVEMEVIARSPAKKLSCPRPPRRISREKAMTDEELEKLLDYVKWKPRDYALILFLADTGCRAAGAAGLQMKDLDLTANCATVREKFNKERRVFFGAECARALQVWLMKKGKGDYVFSRTERPLSADNLSHLVRRCCVRAGIRPLGSHSLRHRKGHQFADARIAPSIAATALGHESVVITLEFYYPTDYDSAARALQELAMTAPAPTNVIKLKQRKGGG